MLVDLTRAELMYLKNKTYNDESDVIRVNRAILYSKLNEAWAQAEKEQ